MKISANLVNLQNIYNIPLSDTMITHTRYLYVDVQEGVKNEIKKKLLASLERAISEQQNLNFHDHG